jgi:hypothetical protein
MAEQANSVANDQPTGPVPDALTAREGDEALAAFFGPDDTDPDENEHGKPEADNPDDPLDEPERDVEEEPEQSEDAVDPETDESEAAPDYADGKFAADTAKVKMPDGRTISVAELKEFADTRVKEFQRDYTAKNMELSEEKKTFETQRAEFSQSQERHGKEREFIRYFAENYVPQAPAEPTVDASVDPVAWSVYSQEKTRYDRMVADWQNATGMSAEAQKAEQEKSQQEQRQSLEKEHAKFLKTFPSLKDPAKYKSFWDRLSTDAETHYGIPGDRVKGLTDTDMVRILNDAVAYRRNKVTAEKAGKELTAKPALVNGSGRRQNPGAAQQRSHAANVQRLRETGSPRDAEAAILKFLGD